MAFFVYIYSDPADGAPFYVGKGQGRRARKHLHQTHSRPVAMKIQQIRDWGEHPEIDVLNCESEPEAHDLEAALISLYGRRADGGILFNVLAAGERTTGFRGHHHTSEAKARIAEAMRNRKYTDEHRAKISAASKLRDAAACFRTPEARAKLSEYRRSPKGRADAAAGARASFTAERQAVMIERARAATLGTKRSPETLEKMRQAMRGRIITDETRAKMSAGQKRRHAK